VGEKLGQYDATQQAQATQEFDEILGHDAHCAAER
jgi:hypothetical protein